MRLKLYALSARNAVGRTLGAASAYTPMQRACATAWWRVLRTRYDVETGGAGLGCVDGECSFLLNASGDKNVKTGEYEAGGGLQWHSARRAMILHHTGIDVWRLKGVKNVDLATMVAAAVEQAKAFMAEISEPWSWYKHVDAHLRAASTVQAKMLVLISEFEQSGSQERDVARRVPLANYWLAQNLDAAEATS